MDQPHTSLYRNALQVSPERIARLTDEELCALMRQLLQVQAYQCGSPTSEIRVNAELKAKDDGCDGWTSRPTSEDGWLGCEDTCWQFKAGVAGEPGRIKGEVTKRIPSETLRNGGRFVLVASNCASGRKGEQDRLDVLVKEAALENLPAEKIEVIGGDRLTTWCNLHPSVTASLGACPPGIWTLQAWLDEEVHKVPWQASVPVESELSAHRSDLDFGSGVTIHLHIRGAPGVGKTRFALELCRGAAWRDSVVYVPDVADVRLVELIDSAVDDHEVRLVIIADEVQDASQLERLRESVGRAEGRVRLITIGHCPTPDSRQIPELLVKPLEREIMKKVVEGWYPSMPPEHSDFVARFADGYVRLALLTANAVVKDPTLNVGVLLSQEEIRGFLQKMLGSEEHTALWVVAALSTVGWTDDRAAEGEAIAKHFEMSWNSVRSSVDAFHRRFGIAPRGGRYRYISPEPLGTLLAVEVWTTWPDLMRTLPECLPSDESRDAYYERLSSIASLPQAREYSREELSGFFHLEDLIDVWSVRRWSALAAADNAMAARNLYRALKDATLEDRRRIVDRARREMVWNLVRLSWSSSSFRDAIRSLALLAEAENETWSNNASGEFVARFQMYLGGTSVPYLERLEVIDELLAEDRPALVGLCVKALAQIANQMPTRVNAGPASDELPEKEWWPTGKEPLECFEAAAQRLVKIANRGIAGLGPTLLKAAERLLSMLRQSIVRESVTGFFDAIRSAYPETREPLRRMIAVVISREKKYDKDLSLDDQAALETLHARFEDSSLDARLQQYIGPATWDRDDTPDLGPLAGELLADPAALERNWPWLTSGEAADAWRLGEALAALDSSARLAESLPMALGGGSDFRLLAGYADARHKALGDAWYDEWITSLYGIEPKPIVLLFDLACRCGLTPATGGRLISLLREEPVGSAIVGRLGFAPWTDSISFEILEPLVKALVDTEHLAASLSIVQRRIASRPGETDRWRSIARSLVTTPGLIKSEVTVSYMWMELASALIADYPHEIASAIFCAQADKGSDSWFIEHSQAVQVLFSCTERDPAGVWLALQSHLSPPYDAYLFAIGFPHGVIDRLPQDTVLAWIAEDPPERASLMSKFALKDFSSDASFASRLLDIYGDDDRVGAAFLSEYMSGTWWGDASAHWKELAVSLEKIAQQTKLPNLRRWAASSAKSLHNMAERDKLREEEQGLRRL